MAKLVEQADRFGPDKATPFYFTAIIEVLLDIRDLLARSRRVQIPSKARPDGDERQATPRPAA